IVPEPFGQVVVQGLAAGIPVIATTTGGPTEVLYGAPVDTLYEPGDVQALGLAVQEALGAYAELSQWSGVRAKAFTDRKAVTRADNLLMRYLEEATETNATPRRSR